MLLACWWVAECCRSRPGGLQAARSVSKRFVRNSLWRGLVGRLRQARGAIHARVPHAEWAARVALPDPGVHGVEGGQAVAVPGLRQHEGLAEEFGGGLMRRVPGGLEDDVL